MEHAYRKDDFFGKGYVYVPSEKGSYIILEENEYNELIHNLDVYRFWCEVEKEKGEKRVAEAKEEAEKKIAEATAEAEQKMKEMLRVYKQQIDDKAALLVGEVAADRNRVEKELELQKDLNKNLKRIARERANQDRKIITKKEHDGYLVLESCQWTEHYRYRFTDDEYARLSDDIRKKHPDGYYEKRTASVWRSVLQTPYDASLPIAQIRSQVEGTDLCEIGILASVGCPYKLKSGYNGMYQQTYDDDGHEKNLLYRWDFKADYRTGLWEVIIYTTKSLRVPPERRPYRNRDKGRKK